MLQEENEAQGRDGGVGRSKKALISFSLQVALSLLTHAVISLPHIPLPATLYCSTGHFSL
jgi:hypothetical protein